MQYIKEDLKRQTQAVLKRTGLDNIRVHYINGCSSSRIFTPPKEKQCCPDPCDTCGSSIRTNQCLTKNCVYKIKFSHCDAVYIGETSRTIGSRIKEDNGGRAGYELIYITNEAVGRVGYYQLISGKSEKNNCFSKFSSNSLDFFG